MTVAREGRTDIGSQRLPVRLARRVVSAAITHGASARAKSTLARRAGGDSRLVVGPWAWEIGFEVLYWIPLLRGLFSLHGVEPERVVAVSRGGAGPWYAPMAGHYVDLLEWFSPEDLRAWHERRTRGNRGQKPRGVDGLDRLVLARLRELFPGDRLRLVHPSLMFKRFRTVWMHRRSIDLVRRESIYAPLEGAAAPAAPVLGDLPDDYVAVKAYFSDCFPDTSVNRAFVRALVERLAERQPVVMLTTGFQMDDHSEPEGSELPGVVQVRGSEAPVANLAVQAEVIRRASALVSTYGGFSYVGPFMGTSTFAFYSHQSFNTVHLDVMHNAIEALNASGSRPHEAHLVTCSTRAFGLLDVFAGAPAAHR